MRFLVFRLFVVAIAFSATLAGRDINDIFKFSPNVFEATTIATQQNVYHFEYNPDEPIIVPPIEGADDDATVCDNGSYDGRLTRACCLGEPDGLFPDGGFIRVHKCRRCKL